MSDNEYQSDDEDYISSEDEDYTNEVEDVDSVITNTSVPETIKDITNNKFYNKVIDSTKNPTSFIVHALVANRLKSLLNGAELLVDDPLKEEITKPGVSYEEIYQHLMDMVVEEIKQGVCPMMYYDPLVKEMRSIYHFHIELLLNIIEEARNLTTVED
jgi:hypothetical protein